MTDIPIVESKSKTRCFIEAMAITIIALSAWIGFLYFIYLTE
jgi:hypothetical protein